MKVLVIGGVAAGTKAAAKLKRENRDAEVRILTKSEEISYAGCGLPYYVGDLIETREQLIVNTPAKFAKLTGAAVETGMEAVAVDKTKKTVTAKNVKTGEEKEYSYDKLVISTGASPIKPPISGIDLEQVYYMRTPDDAQALKDAVAAGKIKRAVVAGGGFIGLEVAENLSSHNIKTTIIDMAPQILPGFDPEVAEYVENYLGDKGIIALTDTKLEEILGEGTVSKVKTNKRTIKADAVILSLGIRPNTDFLQGSGIELTPNKTVKVDDHMRTNDKDIYAMGDCAMVTNRITKKEAWSPMGSSANIEGRLAARNINGGDCAYPGVLGTGIVKLPGLNAGRTGLSETAAKEAGFDPISVVTVVDDKAHYYPGAGNFLVKMVADQTSGKFLGLQCLGAGAVDKMIDIAVMALSLNASISDMEHLDFAYAPPFSTAIHPFVHTVNILLNKMSGEFETFTPAQFAAGEAKEYKIIDAAMAPSIEGAPFVNLTDVEGPVDGLGKDEKLLLVCTKGKRAYLLQNRLKYYGYTNTRVLEGGEMFNKYQLEDK
ncbi:MAG: FAD-dependent oxidoreductase [Lachnospiraceae bacterium]|nr:FAD-dependent oxidoreductase [Lachnospiraceae bacterium]